MDSFFVAVTLCFYIHLVKIVPHEIKNENDQINSIEKEAKTDLQNEKKKEKRNGIACVRCEFA